MDTTSHDTVGASTLATPLFMPSSPPGHPEQDPLQSPDRGNTPIDDLLAGHTDDEEEARLENGPSPGSSRASSPDHRAMDNTLDRRLAEYTVDFSRLPGAKPGDDEDALGELKLPHEEDRLSEVGGPEDFTANMDKYFMDDETREHGSQVEFGEEDGEDVAPAEEQEPQEPTLPQEQRHEDQQHSSQLHQPAVEDDQELGEYSEFGPPVDMSTPSHLLRRNSIGRDITHLENIEEDPDDELDMARTPSVRRQRVPSRMSNADDSESLRRQIAELQRALEERDAQLVRLLAQTQETASVKDQISQLQAELQRKTALIDDLHAKHSDETVLRDQLRLLQRQNEDKDSFFRQSSMNASDLGALQTQISDLQKELQSRNSDPELSAERLETIAYLRQQLDLSQAQLKKRDEAFDETALKLKEMAATTEQQLQDKNTEIDRLQARVDTHLEEIEKLGAEATQATRKYQTLEERISSLEVKNRPLEELNSTLEADLSRAQSQVTAHENALKAVAADLPLEDGGNTYTEILELIKDLGGPPPARSLDSLPKGKEPAPKDNDTQHLLDELAKLRAQLKDASATQKTLEIQLSRSQEQLTESQTLINSIEGENTRLTKRNEDLKTKLDSTQNELNRVREEHSDALDTIEQLQEERKPQQLSPPPSPPTPRTTPPTAQEESHQAQIKSLHVAHKTAISTLRTSHAESTRKLRALLSAAEQRETRLQTELDTTRQRPRRSTHEPEIRSLRAEVERLTSVIAAKDETATTLDQRIARSVEKREKEWERRVDLLLKEREKMARALMWSWGEKEVGDLKGAEDDLGRKRQGYRYKHARAKGDSSS